MQDVKPIPATATTCTIYRYSSSNSHRHGGKRKTIASVPAAAVHARLVHGDYGVGRFRLEYRSATQQMVGVDGITVEAAGELFVIRRSEPSPRRNRRRSTPRRSAAQVQRSVAKRRERAVKLVAAGKTRAEIAAVLGVSETSVYNWLRASKVKRRAAPASTPVAAPPPTLQPGLSFGTPASPVATQRSSASGSGEIRTGAELDQRIAQIRSLSAAVRVALDQCEQALQRDAYAAFSASNGLTVERESDAVASAIRAVDMALAALLRGDPGTSSVVSKTG